MASTGITILSDANVRDILNTLSREDILDIHRALADALHSYSTVTDPEDSGCCSTNQPSRISIKKKDGGVTLFMPATSDVGSGVKIVSLAESSKSVDTSQSDPSPLSSRVESLNMAPKSPTPSRTSTSNSKPTESSTKESTLSRCPGSSRSLHKFFPTSSGSRSSSPKPEANHPATIYPTTPVAQPSTTSATSPKGSVTLLTPSGQPRALINASTLTAFRTALVSCMIFKNRASVHTVTVFGAGMQAFWHIFVALLLRPADVHRLHIVNRDFRRAQKLIISLSQCGNEAVADAIMATKMKPSILTPEYVEYERLLKENVRGADVIFCCTPSTIPLFPAAHLTATEGRRKARYVAAIGSYKPHMQELHEDILRQAVRDPRADEHQSTHKHGLQIHHKHAREGGAVIVDSIEGAMREAGEVIRAGIGGAGVVELGELVMLKRSHWKEKALREARERDAVHDTDGHHRSSNRGHGIGHLFHHTGNKSNHGHAQASSQDEGDGGLTDWLEKGNVVYKGVGIGLMDIVVGMELVRLAEERGIGTRIPDF